MPSVQFNDFNTLLDHYARKMASNTAIIHTDAQQKEHMVTYKQLRDMSIYNAFHLWETFDIPITENTVVGILSSNCVEYCALVLSLIRARAVALQLSTKNSVDALTHLLKDGKADVLIVHPQYEQTAKILEEAIPGLKIYFITENSPEDYSSIPGLSLKENETYPISPEMEARGRGRLEDSNRTIMYIHTSGSTLFPKLIAQGNKQIMTGIKYGEYAQSGLIDSNSSACGFLPLFHVASVICEYLRMLYYGATYIVPPAPSGTFIPTGQNIVNTLKKYKPTMLLLVPWLLEQVYFVAEEDPTVYPLMRSFKLVIFGGAAFSEQIAEKYIDQGINLVSLYGMTETSGPALFADADRSNKEWNLLIPCHPEFTRFMPIEGDEGKELVFLEGEPFLAPGLSINQQTGAFHTGDIFVETPVGSNKWLYRGRYDDILVHSNGEKTRPLPIEKQLVAEGRGAFSNIAILGSNRTGTCLLVELSSNKDRDDSYQLLLSLVEKINQQIPKHSRIRRNMIYTLPPGRVLTCTAKGNIARKKILIEYEKEIEELYQQGDTKSGRSQEMVINPDSIECFIQQTIAEILNQPAELFSDHSKSLIDMGMDSIAAMELHGRIMAQIPELKLAFASIFDNATIQALGSHIFTIAKEAVVEPENIRGFLQTSIASILDVGAQHFANHGSSLVDLGMDSIAAMEFRSVISKRFGFLTLPYSLVFEYPTIQSLTEYLVRASNAAKTQNGAEDDVEDLDAYFERFVDKYTLKDIGPFGAKQSPHDSAGMNILMTGASGYLAIHVIHELLLNNEVDHVYCLIRGDSADASRGKLEGAFDHFHLSKEALLANEDRLTVLPCDLSDAHFGLDEATFNHLRENITHIYHGAWRMDFNSNLEAFEPTCLLPTLNLAKFAVTYSYRALVHAAADSRSLIPEAPHPPDIRIAMPNGYSRSKLVAEEALVRMAQQGLPVTIFRYGQISGNSTTGAWNTREQFPILIRNAIKTGVSPMMSLPTDWIPVNIGAKSLVELITRQKQPDESISVYHEVNPHPAESWSELIGYVGNLTGRQIKMMSMEEWWINLLELAQSDSHLRATDPIFTLLPFFEKMAHAPSPSTEIKLSTTITCERSLALGQECPQIGESLIARYLDYWRQIGFLDESDFHSANSIPE
ncbi:acetyl-CoA synthetase-like protein [Basidiobolus meristosporus CBS 931.73]|uniref:Acetyl-CoA synthetase-like protein n=1 Tax=Basidiobolus meristosporus CBS 931.73 TaxID=1314790 RepID=A0A1Y1XEW9_9FUNG|nr:acetyl-CoA synthetase-like protein [Basidiobolus meristosporus CBS 931.73]|eukprot:ORX83914.1 acetyl-CoA synthetase-like protein [Basidiobolus meristosporus CBS 931.73]